MYLLSSIKPIITFAVDQLGQHNINLRIGHIKATKKIVRYSKGIIHLGLVYKFQLKDKKEKKISIVPFLFRFIGYRDNNYAKNFENQNLVIKYYYFINRAIVS